MKREVEKKQYHRVQSTFQVLLIIIHPQNNIILLCFLIIWNCQCTHIHTQTYTHTRNNIHSIESMGIRNVPNEKHIFIYSLKYFLIASAHNSHTHFKYRRTFRFYFMLISALLNIPSVV